jgi:hypothetical protein
VKLLDISRDTRYQQVVLILGELFHSAWETGSDPFSFAVLQFGRKNEVEDIKYRIKIGSSEENVSMTRQCHIYLQGGLKNLIPGKCITLHYGTLLEYLSESGDLLCEIDFIFLFIFLMAGTFTYAADKSTMSKLHYKY